MTGSIKDYTPNFNLIIPEFNITGWHDYLEENFRSIDALFYNLFGINNFKGQWKNSTTYNVDDVVFVGNDTNYSGRLIKVLVQHTTAGTGNFTEFFTANPNYYELFADASTAQLYAQEAKNWAVKLDGPVEDDLYSSKFYANIVNGLSTEIITLYNIRNDIQNVSMIGTEVVIVSNIKNSVQSVANNSTNINTVANSSSSINNVSDNINVINTVNNNLSDINTVENNITSINSVATNITNINAVNNNKNNINSVAENTTNINNVAENAANISIVSTNRTSINTVATNIANVATNATNINAINTNASNISAIQDAYPNAQSALNSKNLAQEWATSPNLVDNTDYSAKYYANQSQTSAELSAQYANDKINQTHITNCITEIPQNIKLELNNGTLTLKAGSKVYVPNGAGVFDTVTIASDISTTPTDNGTFLYFINTSGNIQKWDFSNCFSGSTAPTSVHYPMWYDITNNIIKASNNYGSTWWGRFSFPICIVTISNGVLSSIDQIFNGFGYIGSNVFVLSGVKGLIPNGRNEDGSLKNNEFMISNVLTRNIGNITVTNMDLLLNATYIGFTECSYNKENNVLYNHDGDIVKAIEAGKITSDGTKITSISSKTVFHALDYNDSSTISGWSMPSSRYINLTLGASNTKYSMPDNGYLVFQKDASAVGQYMVLNNITANLTIAQKSPTSSGYIASIIPVSKGDLIRIEYTLGGENSKLRFHYTNGSQGD